MSDGKCDAESFKSLGKTCPAITTTSTTTTSTTSIPKSIAARISEELGDADLDSVHALVFEQSQAECSDDAEARVAALVLRCRSGPGTGDRVYELLRDGLDVGVLASTGTLLRIAAVMLPPRALAAVLPLLVKFAPHGAVKYAAECLLEDRFCSTPTLSALPWVSTKDAQDATAADWVLRVRHEIDEAIQAEGWEHE